MAARVVKTYIYFIQAVTGGKIKIGYSNSPFSRLKALMEWSPEKLTVLGIAPGTRRHEAAIHQRFRAHWSHHEWFHPVPEILQFLEDTNARAMLPVYLKVPKSGPVFPYGEHPGYKKRGRRPLEQIAAQHA